MTRRAKARNSVALQIANFESIKTWVSFEPAINPAGVLSTIKDIHKFTDLFKVGKLNYHEHAKSIDWLHFRDEVTVALEAVKAKHILKKDLLEL